jgi:hypothetical protein
MTTIASVFLSMERLAELRQRIAQKIEPNTSAYLNMKQEADGELGRQAEVPETWYVPGYYRDAAGHIRAKGGLEADANAAYKLALCYQMTGEERYAEVVARLAEAWVTGIKVLRTEDDSRLSFSYHFPALIFGESLIHGSPVWTAKRQEDFELFLSERALAMNTMERDNNWGNWGLVLVLAVAARLGRADLVAQGAARWKEFIERQIAEDGHLPHEVGRNNGVGERGIWYTHFSLMPQTLAAEILRVNGVDLYGYVSPQGQTLRMAYECAAPWARNPLSFPYFKGLDANEMRGTDYVSYYEILHPRWPNADAAAMLAALRPLSATHSAPALTFTHGEKL